MPSRPMFTTPERSDHMPPRPARAIGTARVIVAPTVPPEVMSFAPLMTRARDSSISPTNAAKAAHLASSPEPRLPATGSVPSIGGRAVSTAVMRQPLQQRA